MLPNFGRKIPRGGSFLSALREMGGDLPTPRSLSSVAVAYEGIAPPNPENLRRIIEQASDELVNVLARSRPWQRNVGGREVTPPTL